MPMYRNIHTKTPDSEDINDMPDDFTRLFYIMFFIILDSAGRGYDKPAWLKSKAFPLREDVTYEMISEAMDWFADRKMIYRYEVDGKKCFWNPKFAPHQHGLTKEGRSVIPAPTPEQVKSWSGVTPEQVKSLSGVGQEREVSPVRSNSAPKTKTDTKTKAKADTKTGGVEQTEPAQELDPPEADVSESDRETSNSKPCPQLGRVEVAKVWNAALGVIQKDLSRADFDAFIRPLRLGGMVGHQLKVLAMNAPTRDWVRKRAGPQLQRVVSGFAGFEVSLAIESDSSEFEKQGAP